MLPAGCVRCRFFPGPGSGLSAASGNSEARLAVGSGPPDLPSLWQSTRCLLCLGGAAAPCFRFRSLRSPPVRGCLGPEFEPWRVRGAAPQKGARRLGEAEQPPPCARAELANRPGHGMPATARRPSRPQRAHRVLGPASSGSRASTRPVCRMPTSSPRTDPHARTERSLDTPCLRWRALRAGVARAPAPRSRTTTAV